jgi:cytochrome c peroxidase
MTKFRPALAVAIILSLSTVAAAGPDHDKNEFRLPETVPAPAGNSITPARVDLGKMLFFDPRLSHSNRMSCGTCHNPSLGWSDGLPTALGDDMQALPRATPSIANVAFNQLQMWDGRFKTLEDQVKGPITSPTEMNGSLEEILTKMKALPGYVEAFDKAYPGEGVTADTIAKAIASFERTVVSRDSPFDDWLQGNEDTVSPGAKRGFAIFTGKANCVACHMGPNFTDRGFHNIGVKDSVDQGRFAKVPVRVLKGAFKTPSLRDVALTAPYMHNGSYRTLEEVIDLYDRGGDDRANLDPNLKPLNLSAQEKSDLVEFLRSLTGRQQTVVVPHLPQ